MSNIIPPITDEMGKYWSQPSTDRILIDDTHAVMDCLDFKALAEYSASEPTGAYEGKMWKRNDGSFDIQFLRRGGKPTWLLCWYGASAKGPKYVSRNSRIILLDEGSL